MVLQLMTRQKFEAYNCKKLVSENSQWQRQNVERQSIIDQQEKDLQTLREALKFKENENMVCVPMSISVCVPMSITYRMNYQSWQE